MNNKETGDWLWLCGIEDADLVFIGGSYRKRIMTKKLLQRLDKQNLNWIKLLQ